VALTLRLLERAALGGACFCLGLLAACASPAKDVGARRANELLEEGREAAKRGDQFRAVELYTRAILVYPELTEAYFERGNSEIALRLTRDADIDGRTFEDRALSDYSMAITRSPGFADALFNRAMVYICRAMYRQAAEDLLRVIDLKKTDPEPHLILAQLYDTRFDDRKVAANDHYEQYVDLGGMDDQVRERVKLWKELKKQMASAKAAKAPTADDEKKASELHEKFKALFVSDRTAALQAVEELLTKYSHTQYVQQRARELNALLVSLKK
jgi:tetratricopeptide (TPR) repeat protein